MEWISVKDRLPSNDEYVIVAVWDAPTHPDDEGFYLVVEAEFSREGFTDEEGVVRHWFKDEWPKGIKDDEVHYWMPFPKPPERD